MFVKANGINVNYEVNGKGKNLVLIHGFSGNLNFWYKQVPELSKKYRIITYDVRGSGGTEIQGDCSLDTLVDDAHELMKAIGVNEAYFLGYSMGGSIAGELAMKYPEMIKALIIANSTIGLFQRSPEANKRRQTNLELLEKGNLLKFAENMTADSLSADFVAKNPAEFEKYKQIKLQNKAENIASLMRSLSVQSSTPDVSKLKCPVLIIVGDKDTYMTVEQGEQMHATISGSKLVIFPAGHASAIESPGEFNRVVLEFLSQVDARKHQ